MSSLNSMTKELLNLEMQVEEFGEGEEIFQEAREIVAKKAENVALFLKQKVLDERISRLKELKKEIDSEVKRIERSKEALQLSLHSFVRQYGFIEINEPIKFFVYPDNSVRRKIIPEKVPFKLMKEKVEATLDFEKAEKLKQYIRDLGGVWKTTNATKLSDVPEDCDCIEKSIRPTVKFLKSRRK